MCCVSVNLYSHPYGNLDNFEKNTKIEFSIYSSYIRDEGISVTQGIKTNLLSEEVNTTYSLHTGAKYFTFYISYLTEKHILSKRECNRVIKKSLVHLRDKYGYHIDYKNKNFTLSNKNNKFAIMCRNNWLYIGSTIENVNINKSFILNRDYSEISPLSLDGKRNIFKKSHYIIPNFINFTHYIKHKINN